MKKRIALFDVFNTLFMLFIIVVMLYPLVYVASVSVSDPEYVVRNAITLLPRGFTIEAYKIVFKEPFLLNSYLNTIWYTLVGTFISVAVTLFTAYPLSISKYCAKTFLTKFYLLTMFFNGGMIPTFLLVNGLNLVNSVWALALPGAVTLWNIMVARSFLMGIPYELQESAHIDGANEIVIFGRIILPLSKPIIATLALFSAVGHWNSYFAPMIYLTERPRWPLSLVLRKILLNHEFSMGSDMLVEDLGRLPSQSFQAAIIIVTVLPILCIYPFVQKYFVKGMMVGSLKG